jgi:xanthosine utilization system XapX-like protein
MIAHPGLLRIVEAPTEAALAMLRVGAGLAVLSYGLIALRKPLPTAAAVAAGLAVIFV